MNNEEFDEILTRRLEKISTVLKSKAHEYASDKDRLHNFHTAAKINNCPPEQALWGMSTKHLVSIIDLINSPYAPPPERVDEKIGDMINYLILLEAILIESERKFK